MASAVSAGNPNSAPNRTKLPSRAPSAPGSINAAARTPELRLSRIIASTTPRGCPRLCITNQISPAPAAHPIRRKRLARNMTDPSRYVATTASSIADALPAYADNHFSPSRRRANFANPQYQHSDGQDNYENPANNPR